MDENNQEHQQPEQKHQRGAVDRFNDSVNFARNFRKLRNIRNISQTLQRVRSVATVTRAAPLVANPWFWIVVAIIIVILLLILMIIYLKAGEDEDYFFNQQRDEQQQSGEENSRVKITISAPTQINNGENLTYTLDVSYTGTGNVIIYDPIPANTEFVSASGNYTARKNSSGSVSEITWSLNDNKEIIGPPVPPPQENKIDIAKYTQAPYFLPTPNGESDMVFSSDTIARANRLGSLIAQHQNYLLSKVKNNDPKYTDPFLSVLWSVAIEGSGANPYSWNCNDISDRSINNVNAGCVGWFNSGDWQVGGIQVAQAISHLEEIFVAIYGDGSAATVQKIGQRVIDEGGITNPATFPAKSINQIIQEAGKPGQFDVKRPTTETEAQAQQLVAILLMDPAINAVTLALEVAGDIASRDNWRETMQSWPGTYYSSNMQKFSNRMQALAQLYTGSAPDSAGSPTISQTFLLTVKPTSNDVYVENQARAVESGESLPSTIDRSNAPANADTCDGYYTLNNPYHADGSPANFGDPSCTLLINRRPSDKDKLYAMLKELDPQHADDWFFNIIPCESGYIPNAYASQESIGTPQETGAWGLYQMGKSGAAGNYDFGAVPWQQQTLNAINHNRILIETDRAFRYWACADYLW